MQKNNQIQYPEWVPESYIEANNLWEKAKSLDEFHDISCEFIICGYLCDPIEDVMIKNYPVADHDLTKVEANFGPYEIGQYTLQVTYDNESDEINSASLHEARDEDFKWKGEPDDIRIAGVDDEDIIDELEGATNIGRQDNPYGQTD